MIQAVDFVEMSDVLAEMIRDAGWSVVEVARYGDGFTVRFYVYEDVFVDVVVRIEKKIVVSLVPCLRINENDVSFPAQTVAVSLVSDMMTWVVSAAGELAEQAVGFGQLVTAFEAIASVVADEDGVAMFADDNIGVEEEDAYTMASRAFPVMERDDLSSITMMALVDQDGLSSSVGFEKGDGSSVMTWSTKVSSVQEAVDAMTSEIRKILVPGKPNPGAIYKMLVATPGAFGANVVAFPVRKRA